jgi:hypothetical protein
MKCDKIGMLYRLKAESLETTIPPEGYDVLSGGSVFDDKQALHCVHHRDDGANANTPLLLSKTKPEHCSGSTG